MFTGFVPAISKDALKKIEPSRCGPGGCTCAPDLVRADLARRINPIVRGWMNY